MRCRRNNLHGETDKSVGFPGGDGGIIMGGSVKRAVAGGVCAAAIGVGMAVGGASAAADPLVPSAAVASVGDIAAPQGMTVQALTAAHRAGIPVYEAAEVQTYWYPKGQYQMIEFRRVRDVDMLGSPTTKFVTVGAVAPDTFYVRPGSFDGTISVNKREVRQENVALPMTVFDPTPQRFHNSPLVQLPGGGPSVAMALVR
jgi:hypothetical protein